MAPKIEPKYFEDFTIGDRIASPEIEITEALIVEFGRVYDPQPFHTDPQAAAASRFGGLIASGWQVASLTMRLFAEAGAYGGTPVVGMGVDELRWTAPVRPGDRLHMLRETVALRRSASKPDRGIVRTRVSMLNQDGVEVMSLISTSQIPTRPV